VTPNDIVEIRPKSRELTPYVNARETAGDRPTPPRIEVNSSQKRVLVHNLPSRLVIDTPVTELLIVVLYSN
jgi:small subunit ribosomal protein S4